MALCEYRGVALEAFLTGGHVPSAIVGECPGLVAVALGGTRLEAGWGLTGLDRVRCLVVLCLCCVADGPVGTGIA